MVGQTLSMMRQAALVTKHVELELELLETRIVHEAEGCMQDQIAILEAKLGYLDHQLEIAAINVQMEIAENMEMATKMGMQMGKEMTAQMERDLLGGDDDDEEQDGEAQ